MNDKEKAKELLIQVEESLKNYRTSETAKKRIEAKTIYDRLNDEEGIADANLLLAKINIVKGKNDYKTIETIQKVIDTYTILDNKQKLLEAYKVLFDAEEDCNKINKIFKVIHDLYFELDKMQEYVEYLDTYHYNIKNITYDYAIKYFEEALEIAKDIDGFYVDNLKEKIKNLNRLNKMLNDTNNDEYKEHQEFIIKSNQNQIEKLSKTGTAKDQHSIAQIYSEMNDDEEAFKWEMEAAKQGHPNACLRIAYYYKEGNVVGKDIIEALKWFNKSIELGSKDAYCSLGNMYETGDDVPQDIDKAIKLYTYLTDKDDSRGYLLLGNLYSKQNDYERAVKLWNRGAKLKNAICCKNLAECYEKGLGVKKDIKLAIHFLDKAKLGNVNFDEEIDKLKMLLD